MKPSSLTIEELLREDSDEEDDDLNRLLHFHPPQKPTPASPSSSSSSSSAQRVTPPSNPLSHSSFSSAAGRRGEEISSGFQTRTFLIPEREISSSLQGEFTENGSTSDVYRRAGGGEEEEEKRIEERHERRSLSYLNQGGLPEESPRKNDDLMDRVSSHHSNNEEEEKSRRFLGQRGERRDQQDERRSHPPSSLSSLHSPSSSSHTSSSIVNGGPGSSSHEGETLQGTGKKKEEGRSGRKQETAHWTASSSKPKTVEEILRDVEEEEEEEEEQWLKDLLNQSQSLARQEKEDRSLSSSLSGWRGTKERESYRNFSSEEETNDVQTFHVSSRARGEGVNTDKKSFFHGVHTPERGANFSMFAGKQRQISEKLEKDKRLLNRKGEEEESEEDERTDVSDRMIEGKGYRGRRNRRHQSSRSRSRSQRGGFLEDFSSSFSSNSDDESPPSRHFFLSSSSSCGSPRLSRDKYLSYISSSSLSSEDFSSHDTAGEVSSTSRHGDKQTAHSKRKRRFASCSSTSSPPNQWFDDRREGYDHLLSPLVLPPLPATVKSSLGLLREAPLKWMCRDSQASWCERAAYRSARLLAEQEHEELLMFGRLTSTSSSSSSSSSSSFIPSSIGRFSSEIDQDAEEKKAFLQMTFSQAGDEKKKPIKRVRKKRKKRRRRGRSPNRRQIDAISFPLEDVAVNRLGLKDVWKKNFCSKERHEEEIRNKKKKNGSNREGEEHYHAKKTGCNRSLGARNLVDRQDGDLEFGRKGREQEEEKDNDEDGEEDEEEMEKEIYCDASKMKRGTGVFDTVIQGFSSLQSLTASVGYPTCFHTCSNLLAIGTSRGFFLLFDIYSIPSSYQQASNTPPPEDTLEGVSSSSSFSPLFLPFPFSSLFASSSSSLHDDENNSSADISSSSAFLSLTLGEISATPPPPEEEGLGSAGETKGGSVTSICISPCLQLLLVGYKSGAIALYEIHTTKAQCIPLPSGCTYTSSGSRSPPASFTPSLTHGENASVPFHSQSKKQIPVLRGYQAHLLCLSKDTSLSSSPTTTTSSTTDDGGVPPSSRASSSSLTRDGLGSFSRKISKTTATSPSICCLAFLSTISSHQGGRTATGEGFVFPSGDEQTKKKTSANSHHEGDSKQEISSSTSSTAGSFMKSLGKGLSGTTTSATTTTSSSHHSAASSSLSGGSLTARGSSWLTSSILGPSRPTAIALAADERGELSILSFQKKFLSFACERQIITGGIPSLGVILDVCLLPASPIHDVERRTSPSTSHMNRSSFSFGFREDPSMSPSTGGDRDMNASHLLGIACSQAILILTLVPHISLLYRKDLLSLTGMMRSLHPISSSSDGSKLHLSSSSSSSSIHQRQPHDSLSSRFFPTAGGGAGPSDARGVGGMKDDKKRTRDSSSSSSYINQSSCFSSSSSQKLLPDLPCICWLRGRYRSECMFPYPVLATGIEKSLRLVEILFAHEDEEEEESDGSEEHNPHDHPRHPTDHYDSDHPQHPPERRRTATSFSSSRTLPGGDLSSSTSKPPRGAGVPSDATQKSKRRRRKKKKRKSRKDSSLLKTRERREVFHFDRVIQSLAAIGDSILCIMNDAYLLGIYQLLPPLLSLSSPLEKQAIMYNSRMPFDAVPSYHDTSGYTPDSALRLVLLQQVDVSLASPIYYRFTDVSLISQLVKQQEEQARYHYRMGRKTEENNQDNTPKMMRGGRKKQGSSTGLLLINASSSSSPPLDKFSDKTRRGGNEDGDPDHGNSLLSSSLLDTTWSSWRSFTGGLGKGRDNSSRVNGLDEQQEVPQSRFSNFSLWGKSAQREEGRGEMERERCEGVGGESNSSYRGGKKGERERKEEEPEEEEGRRRGSKTQYEQSPQGGEGEKKLPVFAASYSKSMCIGYSRIVSHNRLLARLSHQWRTRKGRRYEDREEEEEGDRGELRIEEEHEKEDESRGDYSHRAGGQEGHLTRRGETDGRGRIRTERRRKEEEEVYNDEYCREAAEISLVGLEGVVLIRILSWRDVVNDLLLRQRGLDALALLKSIRQGYLPPLLSFSPYSSCKDFSLSLARKAEAEVDEEAGRSRERRRRRRRERGFDWMKRFSSFDKDDRLSSLACTLLHGFADQLMYKRHLYEVFFLQHYFLFHRHSSPPPSQGSKGHRTTHTTENRSTSSSSQRNLLSSFYPNHPSFSSSLTKTAREDEASSSSPFLSPSFFFSFYISSSSAFYSSSSIGTILWLRVVSLYCACAFELCVSLDHLRSYLTEDLFHVFYLLPEKLFLQASDFRQDNRHTQIQGREETEVRREQEERKNGEEEEVKTKKKKDSSSIIPSSGSSSSSSTTLSQISSSRDHEGTRTCDSSSLPSSKEDFSQPCPIYYQERIASSSSSSSESMAVSNGEKREDHFISRKSLHDADDLFNRREEEQEKKEEEEHQRRGLWRTEENKRQREEEEKEIRSLSNSSLLPEMTRSLYFSSLCRYLLTPFSFLSMDSLSLEVSTGLFQYLEAELEKASTKQSVCTPQKGKAHSAGEDRKTTQKIKSREREGTEEEEERLEEERTEKGQEDDRKAKKRGRSGDRLRRRETDEEFLTSLLNSIRLFLGDDSVEELPLLALLFLLQKKKEKARKKKNRERRTTASGGERRDLDNSSNDSKESAPETSEDLSLRQIRRRNVEEDEDEERRERSMKPFAGLYDAVEEAKGLKASREQEVGERISSEDRKKIEERRKLSGEERRREGEDQSQALVVMEEEDDDNEIKKRETEEKKDNGEDRDTNFSILDALYVHLIQTVRQDDEEKEKKNSSNSNGLLLKNLKKARLYRHIIQLLIIRLFYRNLLQCCSSSSSLLHESRRYRGEVEEEENLLRGDGGEEEELHGSDSNAVAAIARSVDLHQLIHLVSIHRMWTGVCLINMKGFSNIQTPVELLLGDTLRVQHAIFKSYIHFLQKSFTSLSSSSSSVAADQLTIEKKETSGRLPSPRLTSTGECDAPESGRKKPCRDFQSSLGLLPVFIPTSDLQSLRSSRDLFFFLFHLFSFHAASSSYHSSSECTYPFLFHERRRSLDRDGRRRQQQGSEDQSDEEEYEDSEEDEETVLSGSYEEDQRGVYTPENCEGRRYRMKPGVYTSHDKNSSGSSYCQTKMKDVASYIYQESLCCLIQDTEDKEMISRRRRQIRERRRRKNAERDGGTLQGKESQHKKLLTGRLRCESPKATKHISTHEEDERGHVHLSSSPPPPVGSPSMLLELIEYVFRRPGLSLESLSTRLDSSFLPLSSSSSSVPFSPSHQEEKEKEEDAKRSSSLTPYSTASGLKDDDLDHENHAMKKKGEEEEERNNRRDSHLSSPPSSTVTKHTRGKGRVGGGGGGLSAFLSSSPQVFKQFLLISPFLTFRLFSSLLLSCSTTGLARSSLLPPYLSSSSSSSSSNHTGGEIKEEERETQKDYYASSSDHLQAPSQSRSSEHLSNGMTRHTSSSLPLLPPKWVWLASLLLPAVADSLMDFVHSHQAYVSILTALREEVRRQKEDEEEGRASLAKGGLLHKGEKKEEKEAKTITIRRLVGSRGENNEPFIEGRSLDVLSVVSSLESLVREQKETMRSLHMILWQFLVMVLIALPLRVKSTTLFKELLLFLVTGTPPSLSLLLLSLSPSRSSSSSSSSFSASLSSSLPLEERKRDERNEEEDLHAFLASLLLPPSSPPPPRPRPLSPSSSSLLHTSISLLPPPPPTTTTTTATSPIFPSSSSSSLHRTLLRRDINDHEHQHMRERREFFSSSSSVTFFPSSLRSPGWGMACREKLLFTFLEEEAERAFFESGGSSFQAAKALEPYQDLREKLFAYGFYSVVALLHESRRQYDSMLACLLLLLKKSSAFPGRSSLSEEEEERKKKEEGAYSRHGREREKEEVEAGRQGLKRSEGSRRRTEEETGREKKNETRKGERCSEEERRQEEFFQGEDRNVFFLIEELVIRGEDEEEGESFPSFFKAREEKKRLSVEKREDGEEETKQRERMNEGEEEEEAMRKKKKIRDEKASSFLYYTTEEDSLKRKTMKKARFLSHWRYAHVDHTAFLRAISRHLPELVECNSTLSARLIFGIFMYQQRRKQARQTPSRPSSSSKPPSSSSSTSSSSGKAISCAPRDLEDKQGGRTTRFSQSLEVFQNGRKEGEEDKRKREGGMVVKGGEESDFFDSPNDIINLLDSYPLLQMKLLQSLIEGDQGKEGKKGKAAAGGVGGGRNSSSYPLYQISSSSSFFTSRSEHKAFLQTQLVRYLRLLCEHNPQRVCGVLQRQECLPIAACLRVCEEYEVLDACAYLLERVGDFQGIIRLFQHSFSQGLDRLRSLFLVPTFNILPILRALLPRYPSSHALHRLVVAAHSSSHLLSLSSSYAPHSPQSIHSKKKTLKEGRLQYRGPGGLRGDASLVSQEDYLSVPASHLPQLKNEALGSSFSSSSSPMFPASCQTPHTTAVYVHSSFAYVHDDWGPGVGGGLVSSPPPFTHHQPFSGRRPPRELLDLFLFNSDKTHKEGGEEEDEVSVRSFASSSLAHAPPHCRWGDSGEHLGDGGTGSVYGKDREGGSSSYACNDKKSFTTRGEEYLSTGRRRRYYGSKKKRNQHHVYGEEEEGDEDDENGNEEERGDEISSSMMTSSGEVGAAGGRGRRPRKRHIWWSDIPVLHSLFQLVEAATWIGHRNTHLLHKQQLEDLWFGLLALVVQAQQSFPQLTSSGPSRQEASSLQKEREMAREGVVSEEKTDLQRKDGKQQRDVSLYVDDVKKRSLGGEGGEERLKISGEKREEVNERTKEGKERDVLRRDVDRHEDDGEKREKERRERGGSSGERTLRGLVYELVLSELLSAILHAGVMTISSLPETLKRITQTHRHAQLAVLKRPLASMLNGLSYQQELLDVYSSLANSDTSAVFSQVEATRRRAISIKVLNTGTPAGRREEGGGMVPSYTPHPSSSSFSSSSFSQQQPHQEASLVCCKCKGHILLPPPASALEAFRNYFDRHEKKKVSSTPDTNSLSKNLPSPEKTGEETQRGEQHVIASSDAGASRLLPPHEHQQQRHHLQEGRGSSEGSGAKRGEQITRGDGEESYLRKAGMSSILTSLGRGSSSTRAYYAATSRARRVGGGGGRQPYWGGREGGGEEGQREGKSSQNNMSTQHHSQGSMAAFPCGHIYHLACLADEDGGDVPPYEAGCRVCVFVHLGLGKNSHRAHPTAS